MDYPPGDDLNADVLIQWTWKLPDGTDYSEHAIVIFESVDTPNRQFYVSKIGMGLIDDSGEFTQDIPIFWQAKTNKNSFFEKEKSNGPSSNNFDLEKYYEKES